MTTRQPIQRRIAWLSAGPTIATPSTTTPATRAARGRSFSGRRRGS
jgi:hypothetical protein